MTKRENKELEERLEKDGIELDLGRSLFNKLEARNEELSNNIKGILSRISKRIYEGKRVTIELKPKSYPKQVNAEVAGKNVPYEDFIEMISVDKKKFEAYLTSKEIKLKPEDYLVSPGTYDVVKTKIKLPISVVREQFRNLYNMVVNLVTSKKIEKKD